MNIYYTNPFGDEEEFDVYRKCEDGPVYKIMKVLSAHIPKKTQSGYALSGVVVASQSEVVLQYTQFLVLCFEIDRVRILSEREFGWEICDVERY